MAMRRPRASSPPESDLAVGKLCVGGDWACANGDLDSLGHIAGLLAAKDPRLVPLAEICRREPERAVAAWNQIKEAVRPSKLNPAS